MSCPECGYTEPVDLVRQTLVRVAREHGLTVRAMVSKSRVAELVTARRCAAAALRAEGLMLKEIGLVLGNRDHSTIIHALNGGKR